MYLKTQVLNISIQKVYMQYLSFVELNFLKIFVYNPKHFSAILQIFFIKRRINIYKDSIYSIKIMSLKVETIMLY